jgi:hypothetical protein
MWPCTSSSGSAFSSLRKGVIAGFTFVIIFVLAASVAATTSNEFRQSQGFSPPEYAPYSYNNPDLRITGDDNFIEINDDSASRWSCGGSLCQYQGGTEKPNGCCSAVCCYGSSDCCQGADQCETCSDSTVATIVVAVIGILTCCCGIVGCGYCMCQKKRMAELRAQTAQAAVIPYSQLQMGGTQMQTIQPGYPNPFIQMAPSHYYSPGPSPPTAAGQFGDVHLHCSGVLHYQIFPEIPYQYPGTSGGMQVAPISRQNPNITATAEPLNAFESQRYASATAVHVSIPEGQVVQNR